MADHDVVKNTIHKTRKKIAKTHNPKRKFLGTARSTLIEGKKVIKEGPLEYQVRVGKMKPVTVLIVDDVMLWFDVDKEEKKGCIGFQFLWGDTKSQKDNKPELEGKVFSVLSNDDDVQVFRGTGIQDVGEWREVVEAQAKKAREAIRKDAEDFWTFLEAKLARGPLVFALKDEFEPAFREWLAEERKINDVTDRNLEVVWQLLQSIPLMLAEIPKGTQKDQIVSADQLLSFCTAFGWLSQAYREYDETIKYYVGVASAEEQHAMWDARKVSAHHFVIRLVPVSKNSSQMIITYADKLLHQLHCRVHVFPFTSQFELEGTGEVYETVQDLVESHQRLTYCVADNVLEFRAANAAAKAGTAKK